MADKTVAVFGSGTVEPHSDIFELARQTGNMLARAGLAIVNGGYGGTMLAAAEAASQAGGHVIGVTCSAFKNSKANEYINTEIVTDSLEARLDKLIELGQTYIVLPGGTGTLLELAKIWELKNKGFLDNKKPIILIGPFWQPLLQTIASVDPDSCDSLYLAADVEAAREFLISKF